MCLCPIHIANPTRRFVPGFSRPVLTVGCGHCKECISQQQDDWFVRSVFEAKRVEAKGGAVWFPTLTYNDEYLPYYNDDEYHFSCQCFNKDHYKAFRNKLRVNFKRLGYDCSGDNTIRFIYCVEYGGKRGRIHVHSLLYVPFDVPCKVMHEVLQKSWIYGFVMWSKKGMKAQGIQASQYCMKYISKDMGWLKKYHIKEYYQKLKDAVHETSTEEEAVAAREKLNAFRRVMPGHGQSMGFGIDGVNYFKNPDGSWNLERCVDGHLDRSKLGLPPTKKGQNFMYNMPMYYVRKIFYNVDDWNLYKMTEFGKEVFALRFELSLKCETEKLLVYLSSPQVLSEHLAPLNLPPLEIKAVSDDLLSKLGYRTAYDVALYNKVYRDIEGTPENECFIKDINLSMNERQQLNFLDANALDFMLAQKSLDVEPAPKHSHNRANSVVQFGFNDIPPFSGFKDIMETIEYYERELGKIQQEAYEIEREREANLFGKDSNYTSNFIFEDL